MLVTIVIPACDAQPTIGRTIASLLAQTHRTWEAIVVADDRFDYAGLLAARGLADPRIAHDSTGAVRAGCHVARNVGMRRAQGDLLGALDADDIMRPNRLARLAPVAAERGAAADDVSVVSDDTGEELYRALGPATAIGTLGLAAFFALSTPLFPLVTRAASRPRMAGIEFAEDVVANAQLIDRLGALPILPDPLYEYRVIDGSMAHGDGSGERFHDAYTDYIERCLSGDGLALSEAGRRIAVRGFRRKRALNHAFRSARKRQPWLNFQAFVAGCRSAVPAAPANADS